MPDHDSEIERLEAKRVKWRQIGRVAGFVALADPLIAFTTFSAAIQPDSGLIRELFSFSSWSFLPLIIIGVRARKIAITCRDQAQQLRELSKIQ